MVRDCLQCQLPLEASEAEPFCSSDCKNEFWDDLISDKEEHECLVSTDF